MAETQQIPERRLAMLIDGDNAEAKLIEEMLKESVKYGLVTIRRIYGDWTSSEMKSWRETLQIHAIVPIQQFRNTVGKNATDSAMIIDAMDILHTSNIDGFCLVSSDSDYTRLATRIREKSLFVMGIGRENTPRSFVNACDVFVYTENLVPPVLNKPKDISQQRLDAFYALFKEAFELTIRDEDGWAFLGDMGNRLRQIDPSFDPRTYGHKQLLMLVQAYPKAFSVKKAEGYGAQTVHLVRMKK